MSVTNLNILETLYYSHEIVQKSRDLFMAFFLFYNKGSCFDKWMNTTSHNRYATICKELQRSF